MCDALVGLPAWHSHSSSQPASSELTLFLVQLVWDFGLHLPFPAVPNAQGVL